MTLCRIFPLAAVLLAAGLVLGQQPAPAKKEPPPASREPPKPAPGSLEDTLDKALRNSADIKAAEAKVREAEAELNRVRHQVLTRATALHTDLNLAKRMLALAEQSLATQEQLFKKAAAGYEQVLAAQAMVEKQRGELEKLETELKSLRGEFAVKYLNLTNAALSPDGNVLWALTQDGAVRVWEVNTGAALPAQPYRVDLWNPKAPAVQPSMADRIKKLLDQEVQLKVADVPIAETLQLLLQHAKADVPLRDLSGRRDREGKVNLEGRLTVGAWIQAIEDTDSQVRVVVRDYGLLLTTRDRMPEGALRVQDLWRGNYAQLKAKPDPAPAEKK